MVKTVMSAMVMALVAANDEAIQNPTVVTVVAYPGYAGLAKMHGTVNFYDYSNPDLGDNLMIYLGWNLSNVEDGCNSYSLANYNTGSSCTIAIHEGKTCSNASAIGGHLYDYPSSDDDPWGQGLQYDAAGYDAAGIRLAGSKNFDWHGVVVIKDHAGVRARCAVMPEKDALSASADDIVMPIGDMSPSKNIVELAESDPTLSGEGCPFLDLYDQPQYHKNSEGVCQACSKSPWYDTDHKCVCGASAADWITKDQWNPCYDQPQCYNPDATTSDDVYKKCNIMQFAVTEIGREISTFVAATVLAGWWVETGSPRVTIFAPVNKAFKALPPGTMDNLLKPENKATLIDLLKYHALPSELRSCPQGKPVTSACLKDYPVVETWGGKTLHVVVSKTGSAIPSVSVGPSLKDLKKQVATSEFLLSNGVVYMIDGVLLPPSSAVDIMV